MPNAFAQLMIILWPLVTLALFRRFPADRALIWALLSAYLILPPPPAGFDFPLVPPMTKETVPAFAALVAIVTIARPERSFLPESLVGRVLVVAFLLVPIPTWMTNTEPAVWGDFESDGLRFNDALSLIVQQFLLLLPFLLARQVLASGESQRALLVAFFAAAMVYSLPALVEVRLSPQLNTWIYGYFQHNFAQMIRGDGFRPIVFLFHALWLAFLFVTAVVAGAALLKTEQEPRKRALWLAGMVWLAIVVVLCKSYASLVYMLLALPLVLLLTSRMQMMVAAAIAVFAISYPVLKGGYLIPTEQILSVAERTMGPQRAHSLEFRFDNEAVLQARVDEKPLFGWGSWGRNQVFDEDGRMLTISDGRWIITMGRYGWVGFLTEFLLIALPIFLMLRESFDRDDPLPPYAGPLTLLLAINLADMLPNATLTPMTWLVAGTLFGLAEVRSRRRATRARIAVDPVWRSVM